MVRLEALSHGSHCFHDEHGHNYCDCDSDYCDGCVSSVHFLFLTIGSFRLFRVLTLVKSPVFFVFAYYALIRRFRFWRLSEKKSPGIFESGEKRFKHD